MKAFLIKVLGVIGIFVLIDFSLGSFLDSKYAIEGDQVAKRVCNNLADVALLGASEMQNNYVSTILADSLGKSVYNYGVGGKNVYYHYAIINLICNKAKQRPRYIVMELQDIDFYDTPGFNTEVLTSLNTYYEIDDSIKALINLQPWSKTIPLRFSKLFKHNTKVASYIFNKQTYYEELDKNLGYIGLEAVYDKPIRKNEKEEHAVIDLEKLEYFNRIITLCKSKDIRLVLINAPYYENCNHRKWVDIVNEISSHENIPFLNYDQEPFCNEYRQHPEWFYNPVHFNKVGAEYYTKSILNDLRSVIDNY